MESETSNIQSELQSDQESSFRGESILHESQSIKVQTENESSVTKKKASGKQAKSKKAKDVSKVKAVKKDKAIKADFMTSERCDKMKTVLIKIKDLNNQQLKDILRKNNQSMSGNKIELLSKVAEGMMFGRTPKCPNCFGGRPRLDMSTGIYHCSGYYEDQNFFQCDSTFEFGLLARLPWEN